MHVLIYNDAAVFGGHERLCSTLARYLVQSGDRVTVMLSRDADRFRQVVQADCGDSPRLDVVPIESKSRSFQGLRTRMSPSTIRRLSEVMAGLNPDVAVIGQGQIEISTLGLEAARAAGLKTVTYIPWGLTMRRVGAALAPLRDRVNSRYYALADAFVTISRCGAADLVERGVPSDRIHVVPNGIPMQIQPHRASAEVRAEYGIAEGDFVVGCIGQIGFRQKAQDVLLRTMATIAPMDFAWKLVIVGDGPDVATLSGLIESLGLRGRAIHIPWTKTLEDVYAMLDVLVIPSRFEGVPLVMLEALLRRIPVVAVERDGMAEMLPPRFLYPADRPEQLPKILEGLHRSGAAAEMDALSAIVRENHTEETFGAAFRSVIAAVAGQPDRPLSEAVR